jgi:glycosyltransferase involved in cell wall biosynthesis
MKFSLVIPVYNEEESLAYTLGRLTDCIPAVRNEGFSEVEIILVNDGSRDRSQEVMTEWIAAHPMDQVRFNIIEFSRNFGHAAAVLAGLEESSGDVVGIIDADLQDPPELISQMIRRLKAEDVDVIYGQRVERKGEGWFKRLSAWGFYRLINMLTGVAIPRDTGDFRVMRRTVVDAVLECREQDPFIRGIVAWVGFRQRAFPYSRDDRKYGQTKYPLRKMVRFAAVAILSFSSKPLRFALYLGVLGLCFSFLVGTWSFISWMSGGTVRGWTSIAILVSISQSFLFMLIGVQGLYMGRVHGEVLGRPRYFVRRRLGSSPGRSSG